MTYHKSSFGSGIQRVLNKAKLLYGYLVDRFFMQASSGLIPDYEFFMRAPPPSLSSRPKEPYTIDMK